MKYCFSTIGCPEWSWGEILATARDLGYQGVEIRGVRNEIYAPRIHEFAPERIAATRAQLESLGLSIPVLDTDSVLHRPEFRARTIEEVSAYLELAIALGARCLRLLGDEAKPEPGEGIDDSHVISMAKELAPMAQDAGVTLLIETHGAFTDTKRLRRVLDAVGSPAVAALWDIHHPYRYAGEAPETTVAQLESHIRHCHIKDSVMRDGKPGYTMMGYGDLPIGAALDALRSAGYDGFISMEWVRRWDLTLEEPGIVFTHFAGWMLEEIAK